ncbi:MAG: F0F1 ATP synthase subunit A [Muribaculaceae bacterium]|nr:F0F1 ATP synthase subunit A [Muribaculaceae bacterium]
MDTVEKVPDNADSTVVAGINSAVAALDDSTPAVENVTPEEHAETAAEEEKSAINPKKIIFEHLLDGYGWEVPFDHHHRIPLPVIAYASDGLHCFSSAHLNHGAVYQDGDVTFTVGGDESKYPGKLVELVNGEEIRPWDFSITKNVCAVFICVLVVGGLMLWLASFKRRNGFKAPRKGLGAIEAVVAFVYDGVIKPILGPQAKRFAPYLMTVFFFILVMNLLGLIVIFPGGANLTGNIAVTLVLSICTFLATNVFAGKHYWKEIFWPDVPLWLKVPLPIMPVIEIFGMFTKPAALTIRLFANMMGGHMIVITLTLLIFIFSAISPVAGGGATVVSLLFSIFMLLIDTLVSFIQAYVFTMLSTIFIGLAQEGEEHKELEEDHGHVGKAIEDTLI